MMEFFLSKFWAFLVAMVVMGVLVQGMQLEAKSDRIEALNDMAAELERMFKDLVGAGPGLETTIDLGRLLPSTATLIIFPRYAILMDGSQEVRFPVPPLTMNIENDDGGSMGAEKLVLSNGDQLLFKNQAEGSTITLLSR